MNFKVIYHKNHLLKGSRVVFRLVVSWTLLYNLFILIYIYISGNYIQITFKSQFSEYLVVDTKNRDSKEGHTLCTPLLVVIAIYLNIFEYFIASFHLHIFYFLYLRTTCIPCNIFTSNITFFTLCFACNPFASTYSVLFEH